jgi:hypothetical protein
VRHNPCTGQFRINGQQAVLVGSMNDTAPWDHLDYAGKHLSSVQGTIEIDVNDLNNTGQGTCRIFGRQRWVQSK